MTLEKDLVTLDRLPELVGVLPSLVRELRGIRAAAASLEEIGYAGARGVGYELDGALRGLDDALEALCSFNGALLMLDGLRFAKGDRAVYKRWDAATAGRINLGEHPPDRGWRSVEP